jgi:hypothetical protein
MRGSWCRRGAVVAAGVVLGGVAVAGVASAGPPGPANFGIMEPTGIADAACPWPDQANDFMQNVQGVQKCLPQAIPWSAENGVSGVRIVSDKVVAGPGAPSSAAVGQFTFWCQSKVGLHWRLTVQGLAPNTVYPVTAVGSPGAPTDFGTIRTDPNGDGVSGGVVQLAPGGYMIMVSVGTALVPDPFDPEIGFSVM